MGQHCRRMRQDEAAARKSGNKMATMRAAETLIRLESQGGKYFRERSLVGGTLEWYPIQLILWRPKDMPC